MDFGIASTILALDIATDLTFSHPIQDSAECDQDLSGYLGGMMRGLPVGQTLIAFPQLIGLSKALGAGKLVDSTKNDKMGLGRMYGYVCSTRALEPTLAWSSADICVHRFARDRTKERYGEDKIVRNDILGSMVRRGLSLAEAEAEGLLAA